MALVDSLLAAREAKSRRPKGHERESNRNCNHLSLHVGKEIFV